MQASLAVELMELIIDSGSLKSIPAEVKLGFCDKIEDVLALPRNYDELTKDDYFDIWPVLKSLEAFSFREFCARACVTNKSVSRWNERGFAPDMPGSPVRRSYVLIALEMVRDNLTLKAAKNTVRSIRKSA